MSLPKRYLRLCFLFSGVSLFLACQDNSNPNSNHVVITPSSSSPPGQVINASVDKSPMDMSYYPVDYPKQKMTKSTTEPLIARVIYSRPKKDGRVIFGDVLKYGIIWRLGANEATEIEFFQDVTINDHKVDKGRYIIYCVPYKDNWKLVLNNDLFTWGLKIDSTKDIYSFTVPVMKTRFPFELFTMEFSKAEKGLNLNIAWDSARVAIPIKY